MITLQHKLIAETVDSTASILQHDDHFLGFIIEDGRRKVKVKGETRIKSGLYKLVPYTKGEFFAFAKANWGHEFVLLFESVPYFNTILYHWGNRVTNTGGCPLINSSIAFDQANKVYYGAGSREQYKKFYNYIAPFVKADGGLMTNIKR